MALGLSNPVDSGSVEPQKPPLTSEVRGPVTYVQGFPPKGHRGRLVSVY
jgi:hypothetical protein